MSRSNSNLCSAMLPNYLRTYSSALCQIRALEKAFQKQKYGQSVPKILVLNACIWLAKIHPKFTCNTLRILPVTMPCAVLCWQTYLGTYSSAFCHIWALKKALRRVTSAKGSQKSEYYMLAFDWLEQTDKIGCTIFPARMTVLCRAMVPDCLGTLSSTLCQISALKEAIG